MNLFDISGKNAIVIGGAGGIGQAIAQGLAEAGCNVAISSRREESLTRARDEIKAACGKDITYYAADATDEAGVQELVAKSVADMGKIDILVCAQGINKKFPAEDFPMDVYLDTLKVNVYGVMCCCKNFGKHMIENGYGKIVILSSVRGKVATKGPGNAAYASSKGAVDMMIRQLASEFGPHGITVNGLGPTVTETPMMTAVIEQRGGDAYRKSLADDLPMRRMAVPEDCVGTALFLAAPASDFLTGNILYPDGGLTCVR
ncbi:MAG: SDR family NAD(P)-dependent oxidoreductase [Lachnospiraceae bacterium]|jgi:NAD(P)-dependent dehydrogenase (short-subunit alcohol dehydrogenase family)